MKSLESLFRAFAASSPAGAARALEGLAPDEAARALQRLPHAAVGPVVERLMPQYAGEILDRLGPDVTRELLRDMQPRHASALLHHLSPERRAEVLAGIPEETSRLLVRLGEYGASTAGGLMDPQVATIPLDATVQHAVGILRKAPRETLYYLYVSDRDGRLVGVLGLRDLLLAASRDPIEPMVRREIVTVPASAERDDLARLFRERKYLALPVVDEAGRLLGVVKHGQLVEAAREEGFEDMQRMVGAGAEERALSPVGTVVSRRLPWLMVNLATAFVAAAVVGLFEDVVGRIVALAVLLPVVAGQGGNTGAQALAVVMRGIALRELLPGSAWRLIGKETIAGLINGAAVGLVTALGVLAWYHNVGLAAVIGTAMVVNMGAAGMAGAAIPLVMRALGRDPAQSSSIFLTTVTDVVGFASFLGFALVAEAWILKT